jgi:hypothetical protein
VQRLEDGALAAAWVAGGSLAIAREISGWEKCIFVLYVSYITSTNDI